MSGTEADTAGEEALTPQQEEFLQTMLTFRDGLPAQQRDAFDAIVQAAAAQTAGEGTRRASSSASVLPCSPVTTPARSTSNPANVRPKTSRKSAGTSPATGRAEPDQGMACSAFARVRLGGFEPPTRGLEGRRSSAELQARNAESVARKDRALPAGKPPRPKRRVATKVDPENRSEAEVFWI